MTNVYVVYEVTDIDTGADEVFGLYADKETAKRDAEALARAYEENEGSRKFKAWWSDEYLPYVTMDVVPVRETATAEVLPWYARD